MNSISASSPVKSGSGIFLQGRAKKSSGPAQEGVLTASGRSDSSCFAGTGRGTGFYGPNKELPQEKEGAAASRSGAKAPTGCTGGESERKRLGGGEQRAAAQPVFNDTACVGILLRLRTGAKPRA